MKILAGICAALALGLVFALWRIDHVSASLATATDQVTTLTKAADSRRNTQRLLADLDTEHTKVLTNVQAQNKDLLARVGTGAQRLSVTAHCLAVRTTATTAGLDDAEARADIDPAAAARIVAITNDGDEAIIALSSLQDYVDTVCIPRK